MSATPPAAGRLARLARLMIGSNELRRPSDRFEGAVIGTLLAAFIAAVTMAPLVGAHAYQSERVAGASLRPAVAVLTQSGPIDDMANEREAWARWRIPDGKERSGLLTTFVAPDIEHASRGSHVRIWITRAGDPVAPPPGEAEMLLSAAGIALWLLTSAGIFLMLCYWLSRLVLDKRRLAAWEAAWYQVGPRWTMRR